MDLAAYYELWKPMMASGMDLAWWQEFFVKFYQAFLEADRWKQYLSGVGTTLVTTALALAIGIALGVVVAMIRTAHDQQRPGIRNPALGVANAVAKVYVTIIRGTPMMVQLLIMGLVIFKSSRNFTAVGALTLGINSGAYVAEIIRGGLMSLDPGQSEAGRSLGLGYLDTMRFIVIPQAFKAILPALGNEFIILLKDTSHHLHRRQGAALRRPGHLRPHLRGHVPPDRHRLHLPGAGHGVLLAAGQAGKEAASK